MLAHREITCLKGKATTYGARLLSVSRQVGAHLWREDPAGGLQWDSNLRPLTTMIFTLLTVVVR